jgi:hypothetical protein
MTNLEGWIGNSPFAAEVEKWTETELSLQLMEMGYEIIKGKAYNTTRALIVESLNNGVLEHRFEDARVGFYADAFESDVDLIPVIRDDNLVLRYEIKCLSNMPDAHCWNQPYRGQVHGDLDKILADNGRALVIIFDEAAYLRARGRDFESAEWYDNWRMGNGVVPNDRPIEDVLPPLADVIAANGIHHSRQQYRGTPLSVISVYVPVVDIEHREFVEGMPEANPWYTRVGSRYQCGVCAHTDRTATLVRAHFRQQHPDFQERISSAGRVICIISTGICNL